MILLLAGIFIENMTSIIYYGNRVSESNVQKARAEEYSRFAQYDTETVTGMQLLTAVRRYVREPEFYIYVRGDSGMFGVDVASNGANCFTPDLNTMTTSNSKSSTCTVTLNDLKNESSAVYIKVNSLYKAYLLRDTSSRISGIYFDKI